MDDITTTDDEDTSLAKYRKRLTELYEIAWSSSIVETHRDHWDIGSREEMDECRPDSMVISTSRIIGDFDILFVSLQLFLSLRGTKQSIL